MDHSNRILMVDILTFARVKLGWNPDPKQAEVLATLAPRVILNCGRQWGKTTLAATKVVHLAVTRPGWTILIFSENLGQTAEFFRIADQFLARLRIPTVCETQKAIGRRLPNGSRIIGIASREQAVRGYTANFVFIDEAARIEDEVIDAVEPALGVRNGDCWMASTPRGKRGRFWEAWEYGDDSECLKVSVPWTQNPRIRPEFIEKLRRTKGDAYVRQEFECEFVENGRNLVSLEEVDELPLERVRR